MAPSDYREQVYDVFTRADEDVTTRVGRALEIGAEYLDLSIGFLTRIDAGTQEIVVATGDHDLIQAGERCPLDRAYCRRTVEMDGSLAVQDADASGAVSTTAVRTFGLGAYLGVKVVVDDEVYGTVCFAQREPRDGSFAEAEELFVELLGKLIGRALERRDRKRERDRRLASLEREKRRFEGIAENSFDVLFRIDTSGEFTYVSSAVERVLGYDPSDREGKQFTDAVRDDSIDDALAGFERLLDGRTVQNLELEFVDADDETVVLEVNATPIREEGSVVGVQGVGRDVTDKRERERELRMKTRAMDEAGIGITIADASEEGLPLVYVNAGFERLTGYEADEILGENCRFLQGEATDPAAIDRLREAIDVGRPTTVELVNYRADGTPFWNRLRLDPIEDEDGRLTHFLGFQTDVTERKRDEQLIRLLNRVLRHNLRNDMNVLQGIGARLQDGTASDMGHPGQQIERTAGDLVELGEQARRLERDARRERDPERLDPGALVDTVAGEIRDRSGATVSVRVDTDRDVCAGTEVAGALSELGGNAVEHNPADEPHVELSVVDDGDWIELVVADDGAGIDAMETTVIAQGEESGLVHGSGLGLWLVNWIVTRYGGSFQIRESDDGPGSVATVRLPAMDAEATVESVERGPTVLFR